MTEIAREYGEGLWDLACEEHLAEGVLEQLRVLKNSFTESPDFLKLLSNRSLGKEERLSIIDSTLKTQVHPYVLNFLKLLCERGLLGDFAGCVAVFEQRYNEANSILTAVVTSSTPLKDAQRAALLKKLADMTGRKVELTEKVDPAVLGGVLLEMDGKRYDNTVRSRLDGIAQMLGT